jgi:hypothetical protein
MRFKCSLAAYVMALAVTGCIDDPRRNTMPPPGGEPSGYNGTAGVSTMRYEEEAQEARELEARNQQARYQREIQKQNQTASRGTSTTPPTTRSPVPPP